MSKMKEWDECTPKEKIERWVNAERVLTSLPKHERAKHWNMRHWGVETECGTVCCAAGHCGLDPWFNKRGFILKPVKLEKLIETYAPSLLEKDNVPKTLKELDEVIGPVEAGRGGFMNDVQTYDFFGYGADKIFGNSDNRSVNQVIKEVRRHIKNMKQEIERSEKLMKQEIEQLRTLYKERKRDFLKDLDKDLEEEINAIRESYRIG